MKTSSQRIENQRNDYNAVRNPPNQLVFQMNPNFGIISETFLTLIPHELVKSFSNHPTRHHHPATHQEHSLSII